MPSDALLRSGTRSRLRTPPVNCRQHRTSPVATMDARTGVVTNMHQTHNPVVFGGHRQRLLAVTIMILGTSALGQSLITPAQHQIYQFPQTGVGMLSLRVGGDANRDSYGDILVSEYTPVGTMYTGRTLVVSGYQGTPLLTLSGPGPSCFVGDVDGDGADDILVSGDIPLFGTASDASLYSGRSGLLLHRFAVGGIVAGLGDVNADGYPDLAIGSPQEAGIGIVRVFSGKNWALLYSLAGSQGTAFGHAIAAAGDVDGDGRGDFAVAAPLSYGATLATIPYVVLISGQSGYVIHTWLAPSPSLSAFGWALASIGDVDGDYVRDIAVAEESVGVYLFSGGTGRLLLFWPRALWHPSCWTGFASAIADAGDVNQDGWGDILVSTPAFCRENYLYVFSGRTGVPIVTFSWTPGWSGLGTFLDGGADVNGDQAPDIVATAPTGIVVLSASPLSMAASSHTASLGLGATQSLSLVAGAGRANVLYWLLGSLSGRRPGLSLGGINLPLNPDPYLLHTLSYPNMPPLSGSFGFLDTGGNAQASFTLPPGLPPVFLGLTFDHAYVVLQGWNPVFASNAVPVTIVP